jgi:hypothetical protein
MNDRHPRQAARVSEQKPAREVVGRVDHRMDIANKSGGGRRKSATGENLDRKIGAARLESTLGDVRFAEPEVRVDEEQLPVQVLDLDDVFVGNQQAAHASLGQSDGARSSHAAGSDEQNAAIAEVTVRRSIHRG